jgi:AcrR family transcriptional regulator
VSGQRVDAARNRKRVLEAAAHEHARHGSALGMQDVARRAGVGVGTVYRHFPSRQALIEAIATPFFERGLALARSVRDEAPEGERFAVFVEGFARALAASGVHGQCRWDAPAAEPVRTELRELICEFVEHGKSRSALRGDFTAEDAFALLWTVAALVEAANDTTPEVWQRHIAVVLDSLRETSARALDVPPVARPQWDAFVRSTRAAVGGDPADPGRAA